MSDRPQVPIRGSVIAVDDTPANLRLLNDILSRDGHTVRCTVDPRDAIEAASVDPPDMFLIDIVMPQMDGYTLCTKLKENPATQDIPVIFISSLDDTQDKLSAFEHGAVDYITKPFQMQEVLARVNTHLSLWFARREMERFSHMVAHDLRNPLGSVMMAARLLEESPGAASEIAPRMVQLTRNMSQLIDAMLVLAELHHQTPPTRTLDMDAIARTAIGMLQPKIEERSAVVEIDRDLPPAIGLEAWVLQIWLNYLGNAIKHGGSPPRVHIGGETLPGGRARFWVRDEGPGLDLDQQTGVFQAYRKGKSSSGHGLGLAIAKRIADRLGGQVDVRSEPGEGAVFRFVLPAPTGSAAAEPAS